MTVVNWVLADGGGTFEMSVERLLIAGFTGRDTQAAQEHIDELAEIGVPIPDRIPAFYTAEPSLLTTAADIDVEGAFTSGEVEPVIVVHAGRRWLTVGSDHTDRDLEVEGIELSKRACPKPISNQVHPLDGIRSWDELELTSWLDDEREPYQTGRLQQLLSLDVLEGELADAGYRLEDGDVLFLGTVPVAGELRTSDSFRGQLRDPVTGTVIGVSYRTRCTRRTPIED